MTAVESVGSDALESPFVEAYERSRAISTNGTSDTLSSVRAQAFARFVEEGFPAPRDETWKYTPIRKKLSHRFELRVDAEPVRLTPEDLRPFLIEGLDADRIVLVDGRYEPSLSSVEPGPLEVVELKQAANVDALIAHLGKYAAPENDAFIALNTAFAGDGVVLHRSRASEQNRPIHIVNITSGSDRMIQPRILAIIDPGAEMTIVETAHLVGDGAVFVNSVVEGFVGAHGRVDYYRVQDGGERYSGVNNAYFYQQESSHASCTTVTLSGDMIRNNVVMHPDGTHCESHLFGLFVARKNLHIDNHTLVDHSKPDCFSNELYKGVLDDATTGVFNGRVLVRRDAQKTNAYQSNKSVILSERATMNAKPELEIYADDVKCSHGATTGRLDAQALFYLRSRGLTEQQARRMLLLAFVRDVLENIRPEALRNHVDRLLENRMAGESAPAQ